MQEFIANFHLVQPEQIVHHHEIEANRGHNPEARTPEAVSKFRHHSGSFLNGLNIFPWFPMKGSWKEYQI